ncbi:MAG: 50S ribosomal protein L31 [Thermomicrobiales bacterium]
MRGEERKERGRSVPHRSPFSLLPSPFTSPGDPRKRAHPHHYIARITCLPARTWTTRSTKPTLSVDVCSTCHPFYTGEQRIVDTAGQVERFMRRVAVAQETPGRSRKAERREEKLEQRRRLEEMRRNEEEVELAITDAPASARQRQHQPRNPPLASPPP